MAEPVKPRVVYFANNRVALELVPAVREAELVGLVVHPKERARLRDEIVAASGLPADRVFDGSKLREPHTLARLRELSPELGVSVLFGYILKPELFELFPRGVVNLHSGLLPYNRGAHPNVWSIVEGTPAGVTLHYIDQGVDTGDVITQREVAVSAADTAATLYEKLERASVSLFRDSWPALLGGEAGRTPQRGDGTSHRVRDLATLDLIDLDRSYTGRELIDRLRARTFPGYDGAYFVHQGKRVYVQVRLEEREEGT